MYVKFQNFMRGDGAETLTDAHGHQFGTAAAVSCSAHALSWFSPIPSSRYVIVEHLIPYIYSGSYCEVTFLFLPPTNQTDNWRCKSNEPQRRATAATPPVAGILSSLFAPPFPRTRCITFPHARVLVGFP